MKNALFVLLLAASSAPSIFAQANPAAPANLSKRSQSYYFFSRARLLDEQGQWNQAIEEYKKVLEIDAGNSLIYSEIAQTFWRHNRVSDAVEYAQKAVQIDRDNVEAHKLLSTVYTNMVGAAGSPAAAADAIGKAIHEFEEIVRVDPTERQAFLMLGRLYQVQNQPAKAEEIYKKYLGVEPGSEDGVLALADLHLDGNNAQEAVNLLEAFLKEDPESDRGWETLGQAYTSLGRFNKAADAYQHAVELNPDDVDLLKAYAQALFLDNRLEAAAKAYEKLLEDDSNDVPNLLRLGQIYRNLMKYDQARVVLQKAMQGNATNVEVQYEMALLDREDGHLEDAARLFADVLKKTEKADSQYSEAELRNRRVFATYLGLTNSSLGRYDEAIRAFTELKGISTNKASVDAYVVDVYRSAKNFDKALDYAQSAMKESPDSRELQIIHAEVLGDKGRVDEGIKNLQKLATGSEEDFEVFSTMASIYQRAKKFAEAQSVIDTALQRFPQDERVYFIQGALYEKQNKVADAEKAFRKALELDGNNAPTLNYLGYMLADRNVKLDEALTMIQKAVDLDRAQGAYLDSLGWVYFRLNRLDLAEQFLKKAVLFVSTDSDVHDHLAELYFKQARYDDARVEWTKSLQFAEDQQDAQKIRKKLDDLKNKVAKK